MNILPASLLDLGALQQLERACFSEDRWPLLDLMAVLTFPDVIRLKAVDNGRMIGFVAGDTRDRGLSWIATIAVLPQYQNQGVGRALLEACEARLTASRVRLCLRTDNQSALRLYERQGYQRVDIWRAYYKDRADALVMEKLRGV
jgi:ribosomal-protein-alanine N-acetyltransferase